MAFSEKTKLSIKHRAHFMCCVCRTLGVEIHHIIPREDGGADTDDNAAPLCPTCHDTYGDNPKKRKFIRECRDFWFELCDRNGFSNPNIIKDLEGFFQNTASKDDVAALHEEVKNLSRKLSCSDATSKIHGKSKDVAIEKYIAHLFSADFETKNDLYDILFDSRSWYESGDDEYTLLDKRREFLNLYGAETARRLCLKIQSDLRFNPLGFTEEEFSLLIGSLHTEVLLILWNEKHTTDDISLSCVASEDGSFAWRNKSIAQ